MIGRQPYFLPWIGDRFRSAQERLLVLGESHYGPPDMEAESTRSLTQEYINGWNHRFWTSIMQTIQGEPAASIDRATFWAQVAFYNFVQQPVAETAGVAPTRKMFISARDPFFTVLSALRPTCILVLSRRLWNNLPADGARGPDVRVDDAARDTWIYDYDGGRVLAGWIPHPSIYFSWPRWHPWVAVLRTASAAMHGQPTREVAA